MTSCLATTFAEELRVGIYRFRQTLKWVGNLRKAHYNKLAHLVDVEVLFDLQVGALARGDEVSVRDLGDESRQQPQHED